MGIGFGNQSGVLGIGVGMDFEILGSCNGDGDGWGPLNGNASWSRMKQDADAKSLEPVSSVVGGVGPTLHKSMHAQDSKIDPA